MVCVLLATALAQKPVDPVLLALTPVLDGRLDPEEWLPIEMSAGFAGYLQWEPGALHFAGVAPKDTDVVLYLDLSADGWLVGDDNREIRIRFDIGTAVATARVLDDIEQPFVMMSFGLTPDAGAMAAVEGHVDRLVESLRPWDSGRRYLNFAETPGDPRAIFGRGYERLRQIRERVDPNGLFVSNHPV